MNIIRKRLGSILTVFCFCAWNLPMQAKTTLGGALETTFYGSSAEDPSFSGSNFNGIFHQNVSLKLFDPDTPSWVFDINTRISYRTYEYPGLDPLGAQLFYGYVGYNFSGDSGVKAGRLLDYHVFGLTYYDGVSAFYNIPDINLDMGLYGGFVLSDDYIFNENELLSLSALDYRNIAIENRAGDYLEGAFVSYTFPELAEISLDWQARQNNGQMAEHYLAAEFETTVFFKFLQAYGYGVFDMITLTPAQTLEGFKFLASDSLNLLLEHEFFRPVFPADSYWSLFSPFMNNEVRLKAIYMFSRYFSVESGYGITLFESPSDEYGHTVYLSLIHKRLALMQVRLDLEYITGALDNRLRSLLFINKDLRLMVLVLGAGVEYYNVDEYTPGYETGIFATGGAKFRFSRNFETSFMAEYYTNPRYTYNVKGLFQGRYKF